MYSISSLRLPPSSNPDRLLIVQCRYRQPSALLTSHITLFMQHDMKAIDLCDRRIPIITSYHISKAVSLHLSSRGLRSRRKPLISAQHCLSTLYLGGNPQLSIRFCILYSADQPVSRCIPCSRSRMHIRTPSTESRPSSALPKT